MPVIEPVLRDEITSAIEALLAGPWSNLAPAEINNGDCAEFAENMCTLLGGRIEFTWLPEHIGHAAVFHGGLWFDSEAPDGVEMDLLPCVARFRAKYPRGRFGKPA